MLVREVRRWFWDGSLRVRVQRVRIWRLGGMEKGRGEGMGEVWSQKGISCGMMELECLQARTRSVGSLPLRLTDTAIVL